MDCRYCNRELVDYDGKTWAHVGKVLLSLTKLPGFANGVYNVVRTIYYDCSDIRQTDVYLYCEKCKVYFIPCCYCGYPNCIGSEILVSPKKNVMNVLENMFMLPIWIQMWIMVFDI